MNRKTFLGSLIGLFTASAIPNQEKKIIAAEPLKDLSVYETTIIKVPNRDQLKCRKITTNKYVDERGITFL